MIQPPFPSTIAAQPQHVQFTTTKTTVRKIKKTTVRHAHVLGRGGACARGGGYVKQCYKASLQLQPQEPVLVGSGGIASELWVVILEA